MRGRLLHPPARPAQGGRRLRLRHDRGRAPGPPAGTVPGRAGGREPAPLLPGQLPGRQAGGRAAGTWGGAGPRGSRGRRARGRAGGRGAVPRWLPPAAPGQRCGARPPEHEPATARTSLPVGRGRERGAAGGSAGPRPWVTPGWRGGSHVELCARPCRLRAPGRLHLPTPALLWPWPGLQARCLSPSPCQAGPVPAPRPWGPRPAGRLCPSPAGRAAGTALCLAARWAGLPSAAWLGAPLLPSLLAAAAAALCSGQAAATGPLPAGGGRPEHFALVPLLEPLPALPSVQWCFAEHFPESCPAPRQPMQGVEAPSPRPAPCPVPHPCAAAPPSLLCNSSPGWAPAGGPLTHFRAVWSDKGCSPCATSTPRPPAPARTS